MAKGTDPTMTNPTPSAADRAAARELIQGRVYASYEEAIEVTATIITKHMAAERERARQTKALLMEIDKWCKGENQVNDGEDAEDALKYIQDAIRAFLAGEAALEGKP